MSRSNPSNEVVFSEECDICTEDLIRPVSLPCKHKCCQSCYDKINKCHMCRSSLNKINLMQSKILIKFNIKGKEKIVQCPMYFDTINRTTDYFQINKTYCILQTIIQMYGYENYKSFDIDTKNIKKDSWPALTNSNVPNIENILMSNVDEIIDSCLDYKYIARNVCAVRAKNICGKTYGKPYKCNCNELEDHKIDKIDAAVKLRLLNKRFDLLDYEFEKN